MESLHTNDLIIRSKHLKLDRFAEIEKLHKW